MKPQAKLKHLATILTQLDDPRRARSMTDLAETLPPFGNVKPALFAIVSTKSICWSSGQLKLTHYIFKISIHVWLKNEKIPSCATSSFYFSKAMHIDGSTYIGGYL